IKAHPEAGLKILQRNHEVITAVLDVCLHHHEKFDGSGYPHGLAGEQISLMARMVAVCDVYDAVTSDRPYKKAWEAAQAIREMASWKGHFDERIFQHFVKTVGIYPVGA
ncbi:HD-GYP domain-containing protein, partial [Pseudomonas viridiflava]|uniref:HD-GYP domain-containing protein n=1 Tax=Pseudomonas viridiflava TaxID=33069 RepID=UPI000F017F4C